MSEFTPGPWKVCCAKCLSVLCNDFPVAEITRGDWGDEYPAIRVENGIGGKAEAYTEMIEYGHVAEDVALANAYLIAAAPDLYEALEELEKTDWNISKDWINAARAALYKARGET